MNFLLFSNFTTPSEKKNNKNQEKNNKTQEKNNKSQKTLKVKKQKSCSISEVQACN